MENLGVDLVWVCSFWFFFPLVEQQDFCFQPEGGARSVWNLALWFSASTKQNNCEIHSLPFEERINEY